jgi:hypothetical protein
MSALIPSLIIPFAFLICLLLNSYGNWSHQSYEQLRLDSLTLSLCQHRKKFILNEIEKKNKAIKVIQSSMDLAVGRCLAASLFAQFEVCAEVKTSLKLLSKAGRGIEFYQDSRRKLYAATQAALFRRLQKKNELGPSFGNLRTERPYFIGNDGFERKASGNLRSKWEFLFAVKWPRTLHPNSSFEKIHRYKAVFLPLRLLATSSEAGGLRLSMHKTSSQGTASSRSVCLIKKSSYKIIEGL